MTAPRFDPASAAQRNFEAAARAANMLPDDRWVGGYAEYEWSHLRPALDAYAIAIADRDVLEFGCNVGGSSVVLAALGARLSAVDVDPAMIPIAEANLLRHGMSGIVRTIDAAGRLPFPDDSFDLVVANSVLEYVGPDRLDAVIGEIRRVLRPAGHLFICGTASRLALFERHSRRWLVNYIPRAVDRITGCALQRGLSPRRLAECLRGRFAEAGTAWDWLQARQAIHGKLGPGGRLFAGLARLTGMGPGWIAPHIELLLRKT